MDESNSSWTIRIERVQKWTFTAIVVGAFGFGITAGTLVLRLDKVEKATDKIDDINTRLARIEGKLDVITAVHTLSAVETPSPEKHKQTTATMLPGPKNRLSGSADEIRYPQAPQSTVASMAPRQ